MSVTPLFIELILTLFCSICVHLFSLASSRDKTDYDVIRENHRFLWDEGDHPDTWEAQLAKKYYDKLFKEYCICDLSMYKRNKVMDKSKSPILKFLFVPTSPSLSITLFPGCHAVAN